MIAVVQRVSRASVSVVDPPHRASIEVGLCVLVGVEQGDGPEESAWIARKLPRLRIFRDEDDRMNRDLTDVGGSILLVSQFTLAGDCRKGNRPSFVRAAAPDIGRAEYERVAEALRTAGVPVGTGIFGAMMDVELVNDGPVTLILTRRPEDRGA